MKFLALLALLACGKHAVPPARDLADSDGDQIVNEAEEGLNKYLANEEVLQEIDAALSFELEDRRLIKLKLTSRRDLKKDSLVLLTRRSALKIREEHFTEWSRLRFEKKTEAIELKETLYPVTLHFETVTNGPTHLYLFDGKKTKGLGPWQTTMKLNFTGEELQGLLAGRSHLQFSNAWLERPYFGRSQQEVLKEKTYRVFLNDGKKAKIIYVSRKLEFKKLLRLLEIENPINADEHGDMFLPDGPEFPLWWIRDLDGDKIAVLANARDVSDAYRSSFALKKAVLKRINGKNATEIVLQKDDEALFYLQIRGGPAENSFIEKKEKVWHGIGGGRFGSPEKWPCIYFYRRAAAQKFKPWTYIEAERGLEILVDGEAVPLSEAILAREEADKNGPYMVLGMRTKGENVVIRLLDRPASTFVQTGRYAYKCDGGYGPRMDISTDKTNAEAKLELEVEAFVEKLE